MTKETKKKVERGDKTKVKAKNVWKVAEVLIKNPNATQREIAKKAKLAQNTVIKAKEELSQNWTKDKEIAYIVSSAKTRLQRISNIKDRYIDQLELTDDLWTKEVDLANKLWQEDVKLVTVLWWDVTDDNWWLKDMSTLKDMTLEQLDELRIKLKK